MSKKLSLNFRENLISFAWTWICLLIIIGIISLFSLWMMQKTFNKGSEVAMQISTLKNETASANIAFKVEIQEWKNILLRGKDQDDREIYLSKFEKQQKRVNSYLNNSASICSQLNLNEPCKEIEVIYTQHNQLGDKYIENIDNSSLENYDAIHKVDESVRGLDRDLEKKMTEITIIFSKLEADKHVETLAVIQDKYDTLKFFILMVMVIALTITGFSLLRILRSAQN
jgi:hypothetical protein